MEILRDGWVGTWPDEIPIMRVLLRCDNCTACARSLYSALVAG
jgi:hypothetical protein